MARQIGKERFQSFDVLRGLAILVVVFAHSGPGMRFIPNQPLMETAGLFGSVFMRLHMFGWTAMDLLFVLSGFLISGLLLDELIASGRIRVGRFWMRRALRIVPSYYVILLVLGLMAITPFRQFSLKSLLINGFLIQNYIDQIVDGLILPSWALSVEVHFYLYVPFLLILLVGRNLKKGREPLRTVPSVLICLILVVLLMRLLTVAAGYHYATAWMETHNRIDTMLMGILCQCLWRTRRETIIRWARRPWAWVCVAALLTSPAFFFLRGDPVTFMIGFFSVACGWSIIVLLVRVHGLGRFEGRLVSRSLAATGRWSYNIFLWHFFLPMMGLPFYVSLQTSLGNLGWAPLAITAQIAVFFALSVAGGFLGTKLIEEPFMRLRGKVVPAAAASGLLRR